MNGMPHNAKVPLLGYTDTADEAKQAVSAKRQVFEVSHGGFELADSIRATGN